MSVELKDTYFHVPIAPTTGSLIFSCQIQVYQFKALPFSLSLAPHVFTRCMSAAPSPLWSKGMRILPYLHNWLLCAPTRQHVLHDTRILLEHIQRLDLTVNDTKNHLVLVQSVTFSRIKLDSLTMSAALSHAWTECIHHLLGSDWGQNFCR